MTTESATARAETEKGGEPVKAQWVAVWALAIVIAALNASETLPASLLTPMSSSLGVSEGLIGQSVTATAILAIVTSLLISPLSQRVNRRPLLLGFGIVLVLSNLIVAIAPNAAVLLAARMVLGVTVGGVWGLAPSLALRLVPSGSVARAMSIIFGGATVATIAAAPLGAFFGDVVGWRGVFIGVTVLSAVAVLVQVFALPSMPPRGVSKSVGLLSTARLPWLIPGLLGVLLFWGGAQAFNTYIRPYLEAVSGLDASGVSLVLLLVGIGSFVGTLLAAPLMQWSFRAMLPIAAAAEALMLAALVLSGGATWASLLFPAIWSVFMGMAGVGWSTWIARVYPDHAESAGGMLVAAIQGAMMLGALLGGALVDGVGAAAPPTAAVVVLAVAAVYVAIVMRASRPALTRS